MNCYKLYLEIQRAFLGSSYNETSEEIAAPSSTTPDVDRRRAHHQGSLTGITPTAKSPKENGQNTSVAGDEVQVPNAVHVEKQKVIVV